MGLMVEEFAKVSKDVTQWADDGEINKIRAWLKRISARLMTCYFSSLKSRVFTALTFETSILRYLNYAFTQSKLNG